MCGLAETMEPDGRLGEKDGREGGEGRCGSGG